MKEYIHITVVKDTTKKEVKLAIMAIPRGFNKNLLDQWMAQCPVLGADESVNHKPKGVRKAKAKANGVRRLNENIKAEVNGMDIGGAGVAGMNIGGAGLVGMNIGGAGLVGMNIGGAGVAGINIGDAGGVGMNIGGAGGVGINIDQAFDDLMDIVGADADALPIEFDSSMLYYSEDKIYELGRDLIEDNGNIDFLGLPPVDEENELEDLEF